MTSSQPKVDAPSNAEKNPDDWTTGDEPMTGAQASYLRRSAKRRIRSSTPTCRRRTLRS